MTNTLIDIIGYLFGVIYMLLIVQFVLSLLLSFNVLPRSSEFVSGFYRGINALLDPILRPIRRILPDTRPIDFSPLALLVAINIISRLLDGLRTPYGM